MQVDRLSEMISSDVVPTLLTTAQTTLLTNMDTNHRGAASAPGLNHKSLRFPYQNKWMSPDLFGNIVASC